jgi:hypothetical protein
MGLIYSCRAFSSILTSMRFSINANLARRAALLLVIAGVYAPAGAQAPPVTLTPRLVEAGSPELIRVSAPSGAAFDGDWLGLKLAFFRGRDRQSWYALAASM